MRIFLDGELRIAQCFLALVVPGNKHIVGACLSGGECRHLDVGSIFQGGNTGTILILQFIRIGFLEVVFVVLYPEIDVELALVA